MNETTNETTDGLPATIGIRTTELAPLLAKWRDQNKHVPWKILLLRALKKELQPLAGKRYAHLLVQD
jgi:hypothetical protein